MTKGLTLHRDVSPASTCGGQVADYRDEAHKLMGTDFWCVYCGAKFDTILTPTTARVGDGATVYGYSDRQSYTIVAVSPSGKTITIQRDNAVRANLDEDNFSPGGFVGHRSHPGGQKWDITPDSTAPTEKARWSEKRQKFFLKGGYTSVGAGRHEYYDYNF
jgi:hypothetical protein